mgnify:CR=1 FL=1
MIFVNENEGFTNIFILAKKKYFTNLFHHVIVNYVKKIQYEAQG